MDSLFLNSYVMNPHQTSTTKDIPLDSHKISYPVLAHFLLIESADLIGSELNLDVKI